MPEKTCARDDCGRVFDVDEVDLDAEEVRCPFCGEAQAPPTPTASAVDGADGATELTAGEGVTVTITIEVEPR